MIASGRLRLPLSSIGHRANQNLLQVAATGGLFQNKKKTDRKISKNFLDIIRGLKFSANAKFEVKLVTASFGSISRKKLNKN